MQFRYLKCRIKRTIKKFKILKRPGGLCLLQIKNSLRAKVLRLKVILTWWMENLLGAVPVFKVSENLLESKPSKTSRKFPYFEKNQL